MNPHRTLSDTIRTDLFLAGLVCSAPAEATVIHIPEEYPTIQDGINAATAGDTVFVAAGTYAENIIISTPIRLTARKGSLTFIDGQGLETCIEIAVDNVTVEHLMVLNAACGLKVLSNRNSISRNVIRSLKGKDLFGIFLAEGTSENVIRDNRIMDSIAGGVGHANLDSVRGGYMYGLYLWRSTRDTLIGNIISGNGGGTGPGGGYQGSPGGDFLGIMLRESDGNHVIGNVISENTGGRGSYGYTATGYPMGNGPGGNATGVFVDRCQRITIANNLISRQSGGPGSEVCGSKGCRWQSGGNANGVHISNSSALQVVNNTIAHSDGGDSPDEIANGNGVNICIERGSISCDLVNSIVYHDYRLDSTFGVWVDDSSSCKLSYSDVVGSLRDFSGSGQTTMGEGNISRDPLFVGGVPDDYHLHAKSLCIDSGSPLVLDPDGSRSDMGCYGGPDAYTQLAVDAGVDKAGSHNLEVMLDGALFHYPNGCRIQYGWIQVGGPEVSLSDDDVSRPSFVPLLDSTYTFACRIWCDDTASDLDSVSVYCANTRPVAEAGNGGIRRMVGMNVQLDGHYSSDGNKDKLTYHWHQSETNPEKVELSCNDSPDAAQPTFVANTGGMYTFILMVSDGFMDSDPDSRDVTIFDYDHTTLHVPLDYRTIQEAVDAAPYGGTIHVSPGLYYGPIRLHEGIHLIGSGNVHGMTSSIFWQWNPDLDLDYTVGWRMNYVIVEGFTIQSAPMSWATGIDLSLGGTMVEIRNNELTKNSVGIRIHGNGFDLENNPSIYNNIFHNNELCILATNCNARIENNIFATNTEEAIRVHSIWEATRFRWNDVWDGEIGDVPLFEAQGNMYANPGMANMEDGDFHLLTNSPCIDRGDTSASLNDPDGSRNDIGLFGGPRVAMAAPAYPKGLTIERTDSLNVLRWNQNKEGDLLYYAVYRDTAEHFQPGLSTQVATIYLPDTVYWDIIPEIHQALYYRISAVNTSHYGSGYSNEVSVSVTGIDSDVSAPVPREFFVSQNYPNPFNPRTTIEFGLPEESEVSLEIYNSLGQRVCVLMNGAEPAGYYAVEWAGKDGEGRSAASGLYMYRLQAGVKVKTHKMILLR